MRERRVELDGERRRVRELVGELEALRRRRQEQWREQAHPGGKRFSQEELCDEVYPSYKNLMLGRSLRLPTRDTLLRIADYLECTIHETNDLLICAQYLPQVVELGDDEYRAMLEQAKHLLHSLPLPGAVMGRGWQMTAINTALLRLNGLTSVEQIPVSKRNAMHWFLDPNLPTHRCFAFDHDGWRYNAQQMIAQWREVHRPFRNEPWYHEMVSKFQVLPFFNQIERTRAGAQETVGHNLMLTPYLETPIRNQNIVVSQGKIVFPHLVFSVPMDDAARQVYRSLGCPVNENRWEQAITLANLP